MSYIATTLEGLEEVTKEETKGKVIARGRIEFEKELFDLTSAKEIYKLIKKIEFKQITDILNNLPELEVKELGILCTRIGTHHFKSVDVQYQMKAYLQAKGYTIDLKKKDPILYIDIVDNTCFFGYLIKKEIYKRNYRIKLVADTVHPLIANAALHLADYKKNDLLVDPFVMDGIIVIEAALQKKGKVFGYGKNLRCAKVNAKIAKIDIEWGDYSLDWLDTKFKKESVKIVTYLPSVSKTKLENQVKTIYKDFFHQAEFIVKKEMVVIVRNKDFLKEYLTAFTLEKEYQTSLGETTYYILALKRTI